MRYLDIDGTTWPIPDSTLEWRLRYGNPTRGDILNAAEVISAYFDLVKLPNAAKHLPAVRRKMREAKPEEVSRG